MKLDPKFKKLWIAALRGGNYKQGDGVLRDSENKCCCLGVAVDLLVQDGKAKWSDIPASTGSSYAACSGGYEGYWGMPPPAVCEIVGLSHDDAEKLALMNDEGDSFKKIAQYIEDKL